MANSSLPLLRRIILSPVGHILFDYLRPSDILALKLAIGFSMTEWETRNFLSIDKQIFSHSEWIKTMHSHSFKIELAGSDLFRLRQVVLSANTKPTQLAFELIVTTADCESTLLPDEIEQISKASYEKIFQFCRGFELSESLAHDVKLSGPNYLDLPLRATRIRPRPSAIRIVLRFMRQVEDSAIHAHCDTYGKVYVAGSKPYPGACWVSYKNGRTFYCPYWLMQPSEHVFSVNLDPACNSVSKMSHGRYYVATMYELRPEIRMGQPARAAHNTEHTLMVVFSLQNKPRSHVSRKHLILH